MLRKPFLFALALATLPAFAQQTPIRITADITEAPRKLYHAEIDLPVKPGPNSFVTPKWIPGNHRPTGPVEDITGVVFSVDGKPIAWRRDDVDLYEYHVDVPKGVTTLHAHLDCIVTSRASDHIAVLEWEKLLLYPAHKPVHDILVEPSVTVPAGWGIGTALIPISGVTMVGSASTQRFGILSVEQLQDSPIITGAYFHEFPLAPEITPKHYIDVVSDDPADSDLRPELLAELSNLVRETGAAYASRHYTTYHFLLTLSDITGGEGLEHGQSSDNGIGELGFSDEKHQLANSDLLAHEFTHSWNGKYRRPATLYQPDFATAQQGELLWVYEGMTQYLGNVLAARSGLKSAAQYRDILAASAANLDYKSGREWRSTDDTAIAASVLRGRDQTWANWRRGQDYYQEGELLWLDADTKIRELTADKKSLTDFLHIFLGKGGDTGPLIVPYTRAELIADLNQIAPYDWATFLHDRVDNVTPHADLDGITRGGYKLVYLDHPTKSARTTASARGPDGTNVWYSLGLRITPDGTISDVRWGSPADKAKLAPGQKLIAVNGRVFAGSGRTGGDDSTPNTPLHAALVAAKSSKDPIHFLVQTENFIFPADIDYHDGERFPAMVRVDGTTDYLDEITTPLTKPPAK